MILATLSNKESSVKAWYQDYYRKHSPDRNNEIYNSGATLQKLALDLSLINALSTLNLNLKTTRVLDIGCGDGSALAKLVSYGFQPSNLFGVDINQDRIKAAISNFPSITFSPQDATELQYQDCEFDLVIESTMFVSLVDDNTSSKIATEMLRVLKPGGHVILLDWRYGKPWDNSYKACSRSRVSRLFTHAKSARLLRIKCGALVPPLGRFISKYLRPIYFLVQAVLPFSVAQVAYILKKT